ncbi:hypothetical protein AGMMS50268_01110 [Spirochaetia bacterium]|nr:hypothetical protein AGMMS50268_01110 [Spirochaetia bacterium]
MAASFEEAVTAMVREQGAAVFDDPVRCKNFLADYAVGNFAKEKKLFMRILEEGCAREIATTGDVDIAKRKALRHLTEDVFLAEGPPP